MGSRRTTPAEYGYDDLPRARLVPGVLADTRLHVLLVLAALLALLASTGRSATRAPLASEHAAHCRVCDHFKQRAGQVRNVSLENELRQHSVVE